MCRTAWSWDPRLAARSTGRTPLVRCIRNNTLVDRDLLIMRLTRACIAIRSEQCPEGGFSALLAASSSLPSVVKAISSTRVVPPVLMVCLIALGGWRIEINHLERAVAVAGIEPAAMRRNAIGSGDVVVHAVPVAIELTTPTKPPMVRLNFRVWVSMTSIPEFERSAK